MAQGRYCTDPRHGDLRAGASLISGLDSKAAAESITRVTGQKLNYVVTALLAAAVIFLLVDAYVLTGDSGAPASATAAEGARLGGAPVGDAISVAVLPFRNLSADPEQQYFTDGFSEELLNSLAQIKDLRVPARTSSFSFADSALDVREIAAALDAACAEADTAVGVAP